MLNQSMDKVKSKIETLLKELNTGIYEKEEAVRLALLSSLAGESIFLLGPPGVAKSLIARRLKFAFQGKCGKEAGVFEYLMSRFSTPDEIFGPVAISELKSDKYKRVVNGYLPDADIVFLDEIWKAGPSIQNALLTVLNEKVFRNGEEEIKVPMKALISASNELPSKGEGLEALWDRFLARLVVEGIEDREKFDKMISDDSDLYNDIVSNEDKISDEEYKNWSEEISKIKIPDNVFNVIHVIRNYIAEHNKKEENEENRIYVSDRRWRKIVRLLRASAFLNGRKEVDLMDCFLIKHCLWNDVGQIDTVHQFVRDAIEQYGYTVSFDFKGIREEIEDFTTEIAEETKVIKDTRTEVLENIYNDYYGIIGMSQNLLIKQSDYENLTNDSRKTPLYSWNQSYYNVQSCGQFQIRAGNSEFSLFINNEEYNLTTKIDGEKRKITKKPHPAVKKAWNKRVNDFLTSSSNMKIEIEKYRQKDLAHLRTNLFVSPELANVVESHINSTIKDIEKIELTIREIQNYYKNLKDEEIVIDENRSENEDENEDDRDE